MQPTMPAPARPPRRHRVRRLIGWTAVVLASTVGLGTALSSLASSGSQHVRPAAHSAACPAHWVKAGTAGACAPAPGDTTAPAAPAPAPPPPSSPTRVKFIVTGDVPPSEFGTVDISYGANNDTHDVTLPSLGGRLVYSVPFKHHADYYAGDVMFDGTGHATMKIVVTGPGLAPLTVSHGSAAGHGTYAGGDASAQAAPNDSSGTSWYNES